MKSLIVAAAATSILLLSACTGPVGGDDGQDGSSIDFWGNEVNPSDPLACDVGEASPPAPPIPGSVFDPAGRMKPADTPPGNNWVVLGLSVVALSPEMQNNYCIPVHVTYEKRTAEPDIFINGKGVVVTKEFYTTTPWQGYVSFDYDPTLERFQGRPPMYEVVLKAVYVPIADAFNGDKPVGLGCHIKLFGANVASDIVVPLDSGGVCTTSIVNNYFNLA